MRLYLRCVWANKATFIGFVFVAFAVTFLVLVMVQKIEISENDIVFLSSVLCILGFALLVVTGFGLDTYWACKSVLSKLEKHEGKTEDFVKLYGEYCGKAGAQLAGRIFEKQKMAT